MFRLFAFILTILGGLNWLMIGSLQYDFVAGIFGTQSNVFSRIVYVIIGAMSMYIMGATILNRGKLKLFNYKKKPRREVEDDDD